MGTLAIQGESATARIDGDDPSRELPKDRFAKNPAACTAPAHRAVQPVLALVTPTKVGAIFQRRVIVGPRPCLRARTSTTAGPRTEAAGRWTPTFVGVTSERSLALENLIDVAARILAGTFPFVNPCHNSVHLCRWRLSG
jgi:hypothetical protein